MRSRPSAAVFASALAMATALALAPAAPPPCRASADVGTAGSTAAPARQGSAELHRAGRYAEALAALREELAARPGDPLLLYNRACLENRLGRAKEALASLQAALAAGFDDLEFAAADEDLRGGDAAPRLAQAIADERARRGGMSGRRGARLAQGVAVTLPLEPAPGDPAPDGARVTVTWQPTHLDLRLEAPDGPGRWLRAGDSVPWNGTGGLVVVLGPLAADGSGETTDAFVFGFGLEKNAGTGAVFVAGGGWQRVRELAPKIRGAGSERLVVDIAIPWSAIAPYHPLVDAELGLNVALLGVGGSPGPRLMPARVLDRLAAPRHLAARLECDGATAAHGALAGRTPGSLVKGDQLALNLVAVSAQAGRGTLTLAFRDSEGHSLLGGDAAAPQEVDLATGITRLNRAVAFAGLRPGPCHVRADLALPDGARAEWATWLLNLGPDWEAGYRRAIVALPADEQPTAAYFLERIEAAVAAHRGRRDPGPLATTMADLNLMLARFDDSGSILPAEGLSPFVYAGPGGASRLCRLVLPPGRPQDAPLQPVVVAGHGEADAPRLAERLLRLLASGEGGGSAGRAAGAPWPVFVVAPAVAGRDLQAPAELEACVRWAGARFGAGRCLVAAQQAAVAPAIELAAGGRAGLEGLQLFIDGRLPPWPAGRELPPPPALPVAWVEFTQETAAAGGGRELGAALRQRGWRLQESNVAGGAAFTQVADHACLWQAALAAAGTGR